MKNIFLISIAFLMMNLTLAQGNVGIGTTTPTAKLDVIGTIKITDGTQGDGKVLTSDATGRASWQTVSTSSGSGSDYPVVSIGCATWMTQNLDVTTYRDGTDIPLVTDSAEWAALTTGAYCFYNNNGNNNGVFGKLYNWYAVNNPKGLAPEGWHIPSDFEWTTLVNTLGGNNAAGGPMKAMGTTNWFAPNLGASNLCNFTAQPGGQRNAIGSFSGKGNFAYFWTSTSSSGTIAWSRKLNTNDTVISGAGTDMRYGYSVRCVRD